jgi:hypothetical protein
MEAHFGHSKQNTRKVLNPEAKIGPLPRRFGGQGIQIVNTITNSVKSRSEVTCVRAGMSRRQHPATHSHAAVVQGGGDVVDRAEQHQGIIVRRRKAALSAFSTGLEKPSRF